MDAQLRTARVSDIECLIYAFAAGKRRKCRQPYTCVLKLFQQ